MTLKMLEPNIQETEAAGRKRTHTEFAGDDEEPDSSAVIKASAQVTVSKPHDSTQSAPHGSLAVADAACKSTVPKSSSPRATETRSPKQVEICEESDSPNAAASKATKPASSTSTPKSKPRLSLEEKTARENEKAQKRQQKEAQAAQRAAEKAKLEEEKAVRAKEREEKRRKKEEEDAAKAERRRQREEEQRRIQEDKDKKARSQKKLNDFFRAPNTPKKTTAGPGSHSASPSKPDSEEATPKPVQSAYDQLFKPFYVRDNTRWTGPAPLLDEETRNARSHVLDGFIGGCRQSEDQSGPLDVAELLHLPCKPRQRGWLHRPVRQIMEKALQEMKQSGTDVRVAASSISSVRKGLAKVPIKVIAFSRDVRPPYRGTMTSKPFDLGLEKWRKLARNTTNRRLPLDYDYDSEAEWQDEEGEDIDVDDDDEEQDEDDDMDGFLDDSEDAGLSRRVFAKTMEPESSGIWFDNAAGRGSVPALSGFRMEFMHEGLKHNWGVDPWSSQYWEPEEKRKLKAKGGSKMAPPKTPATAFEAMKDGEDKAGSKTVRAEHLDEVKKLILQYRDLSKGSIIDIIFHKFRNTHSSVSRAEVKNTVDMIAEKKGAGRSREWGLRAGFEIEL
ncbi:Chromatin assembly factor 1 subunit A [Ophiocordyceps camponoti-floridani]|uniref:Chromatin assembly factor 1 subunit A n=1 Tax=Ophiocordyceps camponoti-floridani TaxID=2030778 RepID=A0A8H4Q211_9HYPO|nr:Chromatin assembly factor 1 subunit A [Ophiocordyceps camponoti-floridani]